ncbi:MAG: flagellar hook-length control protein FliK [Candidatus Competibacteraceae bacterium]|nr:flagellar hook-length control protein FliK [Candidatus Competibacteraceae bacterium]
MAQLELANVLAANGAAAKPVAAGAGVEGGAPAGVSPFSFSQWLQSDAPANPAADAAGALPGDVAGAAATSPAAAAPAAAIAAPAVDPGKAEIAALAITLTAGAAAASADEAGAVEEPVAETDADDRLADAGDDFAAEPPWLGLPLVMDARAALRQEDIASADSATDTETAGIAAGDSERLRSLLWSSSASARLTGARAAVRSNGEPIADAATVMKPAATAVAPMPETAGGLPPTGLDAALRPLMEAGRGQEPPAPLMPSQGLEAAAATSGLTAVAANPPGPGLAPQAAESSEPAVSGGGVDATILPPSDAPLRDRAAVSIPPQSQAAAPSGVPPVAAGATPVRATANAPAPLAVENAATPRPLDRLELATAAVATVAVAAARTEDKAKASERWPAARLLANQSIRWALERADAAVPAEIRRSPAAEVVAAAMHAPTPASTVAVPASLASTATGAASPSWVGASAEAGAIGHAPSPETDGDPEAASRPTVAAAKNFTSADRPPALGQQPMVAVPGTFEDIAPDRGDGRPSEPVALTAGGTLPQARPLAASNRPEAPAATLLPSAPDILNLHQKHWERTLGQQLHWMINNQVQEAEIKVNPPDLGPLEVRVSLHHQQTNVTFFSHEAAVREALETALPRLRELLDAQGINLNQTQVADPSLARQQAGTGQQPAYGQRDGRDRPPSLPGAEPAAEPAESRPRARGLNGVVDDYA